MSTRQEMTRHLINEGDSHRENGNLDRAECLYVEALHGDPASIDALFGLGAIASHRGNPAAAGELARKALAIDPEYQPGLLLLHSAYFDLEQHDDAWHTLDRWAQIGLRQENMGRYAEAERTLRSILEHDPGYVTRFDPVAHYSSSSLLAGVHHALARVLQRQGNVQEARLHYHLAMRVDPQIELNPMYAEIMSEADLNNHPYFRPPEAPEPGPDADLGEKVNFVLLRGSYEEAVDAVAKLKLADQVEALAEMIQALQSLGAFCASANVRLIGDLVDGKEVRGLFEGLRQASWIRLLELSEELKKRHFNDAEASKLACRIQIEPSSVSHFRHLLRRFVRLEPDTGRYVSHVACSSMTQSPDRLVRAAGYEIQGLTSFMLGFCDDAERALLRACDELDADAPVDLVASAFEQLCDVQMELGKIEPALQNAQRFVALAAMHGGPSARAEAEYLSARVLGRKGDLAGSLAAALRAQGLVRTHGLTGTLEEYLRQTIAVLREHLGGTAADPPGTPTTDTADPTLGDEVSRAEDEIEEGQHDRALERLRRVRTLAREAARYDTLIRALVLMGHALRVRGDVAEAGAILNEALTCAESYGPYADKFVIFVELSFVAEQRAELDDAVLWMENALAESRRTHASEREAASHERLALLVANTDTPRAIEHMERAIEGRRTSREDYPTELQRGQDAYRAQRFDEAIVAYEAWLARDPPRDAQRVTAIANLGGAYYALRDLETAIRFFGEAADLVLELGVPAAAVELLSRAAMAKIKLNQDAGVGLAKLIAAAESVSHPALRRSSLVKAADVATMVDKFEAGERLAREALVLATSDDWRDLGDEVESRMMLGRVYRATGRYREALDEYTAALAIAQRLSDEPQEGTIRGWKAVAHRYLNEPDRSVEEYSKAIQIAARYGNVMEAACHRFNMASVLIDLERRDDALEAHLAALHAFDREGLAMMSRRVLMALADAWSEQELPSEITARVRSIEEELLTSGDRIQRCVALCRRAARLAAHGEAGEAARLLDEVIEMHRRVNDLYNLAVATLKRARYLSSISVARAAQDAEQALETVRSTDHLSLAANCLELLATFAMILDQDEALEQRLEELRSVWLKLRGSLKHDGDRVRHANRTAASAKALVSRLLARGWLARAFELIESSRAQALADLIASRLETALPTSEQVEEDDDMSGAVPSSLLKSPVPEQLTVVRAPLRLDETATLLGRLERDAILISMSYVDDRLVGFALRADQKEPDCVSMDITREDVSALVATYRSEMYEMCGAGALSWLHAGSRLIQPFERYIREGDLVLLVLDSDLQILPISALELTRGERLIDRAAVCHAPSATVLGQLADRKAARKSDQAARSLELLSIGIAYPEEAIAVEREFGGVALTGNAVSKSEIRNLLPRHRILHVSSHGHFDPSMPLESGLHLLSSGSTFLTHILSVRDLSNWRLGCDLITLSACESGRGQIAVSEFLGLTRNLLAAGADSVVATLWPVDPKLTIRFMCRFYHELSAAARRSTSVDIAEALRQAQIGLGREVDLAGWAGFKLVGWPRMAVDRHVESERQGHG